MSSGARVRRVLSFVGPGLVVLVVGLWLYRVIGLHDPSRGRVVQITTIPAGVALAYLFDNTLGKPRAECAPERGGVRCVVYEDALQVPESTPRGLRWSSRLTIQRSDVAACRASTWRPVLAEGTVDAEVSTPADPCTSGWTLRAYWYRSSPF